jgi:hypothetical protein
MGASRAPGRARAVARFLDHVRPAAMRGSPADRHRPPLDRAPTYAGGGMIINDPALLAEVTAAFHEYERALMADDIPAMDALFHDAPTTNRYGVGEVLYGIEEIREFRKGRRIAAARLGRVAITVYGDSFATADAEFFREGSEARAPDAGWVKFADGWKVVSAHVSLEGSTLTALLNIPPGWRNAPMPRLPAGIAMPI